MTILPKKKTTKDKNDPENTDHSHHPSSNESRHEKVGRSRNSPTRWLPASTSFEDKRDSGGSSYDGHDNNPNHNKRRHRSSPHRNVRKHRHDPRGGHHPPSSSSSHVVVGGSVVPGAGSVGVGVAGSGSPPSEYDSMNGGYNSEDEHATPGRQFQDNTDEVRVTVISYQLDKTVTPLSNIYVIITIIITILMTIVIIIIIMLLYLIVEINLD